MEGHGNLIAVGHAELLRRFFLKVYTKLRAEGLEESAKVHDGRGLTQDVSVATLSTSPGLPRWRKSTQDDEHEFVISSNDICQADVSACLKFKIPSPVTKFMGCVTSAGSLYQVRLDEPMEVAKEDEHEFIVSNNDEYGVQGDLADVSASLKPKMLSSVTNFMGRNTGAGTRYQDRLDEARELDKEVGGGLLLVAVAGSISWQCVPFFQTFSGPPRRDDPGGSTGRVHDPREAGTPSLHAAVPSVNMSAAGAVQYEPEDGGVMGLVDLISLNFAFVAVNKEKDVLADLLVRSPFYHPSPGARTRSMDVPAKARGVVFIMSEVRRLNNHSISDKYGSKASMSVLYSDANVQLIGHFKMGTSCAHWRDPQHMLRRQGNGALLRDNTEGGAPDQQGLDLERSKRPLKTGWLLHKASLQRASMVGRKPDPEKPTDPDANPSDKEPTEEEREQYVGDSWKYRTESICPQYDGSRSLSGRCNHVNEYGTCFDQVESDHEDEGAMSPAPPPPDALDEHIRIQERLQDWDCTNGANGITTSFTCLADPGVMTGPAIKKDCHGRRGQGCGSSFRHHRAPSAPGCSTRASPRILRREQEGPSWLLTRLARSQGLKWTSTAASTTGDPATSARISRQPELWTTRSVAPTTRGLATSARA